jgi:hypothetical protein
VLLVLVGFLLGISTVYAGPTNGNPESGSVGLTGVMPGKPPTVAATIESPVNQQRFTATPITISGTCPENTLVELYKNDIFAGSTPCNDAGRYSIEIDLLIGENKLIARVYDSLNQAGPDSNAVTVYYDALPAQLSSLAPLNFGGAQLLLNTDAVFRGSFPGQEMSVPIDVIGGTPPYAINVLWGDGTNRVEPRSNNITFDVRHTYKKAGTYKITIQGTDSQGRVAFLSVAAIINGQPDAVAATSKTKAAMNKLLVLWPLYTTILSVVISFWLGERREKKILTRPTVLLHHTV